MIFEKTIFELIMLICFGISWPFAIAKTLRTKTVKGQSTVFYVFIVIGYISGILYKFLYNMDYVIYFYAINTVMVTFQIFLIHYYRQQE